jgi:purine-binding chemotaxis protein CheW
VRQFYRFKKLSFLRNTNIERIIMLTTQENTPHILQNKTNLVIFRLNRIDYAIAVEPIQQIIEMVIIIPVLNTEKWMEGVINYHGASVPVVNLRRHFGMEIAPYRWHTPIILVNIANRLVGLIVDEVLDVLALPDEQIVDPSAILPWGVPKVSLLKSIIQTDQNITLLLDLAHLFDQVQVRALSAAANALGKKTAHTAGDPARSQKPETIKPGGVSKDKAGKAKTPRAAASKQPEKPSAVDASVAPEQAETR